MIITYNKKNYFKVAFFIVLINININNYSNPTIQLNLETNNNLIISIFIFSVSTIFCFLSILHKNSLKKSKEYKAYLKKIKKFFKNSKIEIQSLINNNYKGIIHSYKYITNINNQVCLYDIHSMETYSIVKDFNQYNINIVKKFFQLVDSIIQIIQTNYLFQNIINELTLKKINLHNIIIEIILDDIFMQTLL